MCQYCKAKIKYTKICNDCFFDLFEEHDKLVEESFNQEISEIRQLLGYTK